MADVKPIRGPAGDGPTGAFELLPAIDLRGGRVVRLRQGDFARETGYGDDPVAVAEAIRDGRRDAGSTSSTSTGHEPESRFRRRPSRRSSRAVEPDGCGSRSAAGCGQPASVEAIARRWRGSRRASGRRRCATRRSPAGSSTRHGADRIAVALDVRDGLAVGEGWRSGAAGVPVRDAVEAPRDAGVETLIVTAIDRDGLLEGPDLELLGRAGRRRHEARIIASGGIARSRTCSRRAALGCVGAIVGRALYEGRFDLRAALAAVDDAVASSSRPTARRAVSGPPPRSPCDGPR